MYYSLSPAEAKEETTGFVWPQISNESPIYLNKGSNSVMNLVADKFPDFIPDLNYYELDKKAKLTDMLSGGKVNANGFVISEKLKEIFERHYTVPTQYYPAKIKMENSFVDNYYLMQIVSDLSDNIDFRHSKFRVRKLVKDLGEIELVSKEDFRQKWDELLKTSMTITIRPDVFAMNNNFDNALDLFMINFMDFNVNISERLRNCLIEERVTGIQMKETNIVVK